MTTPSDPAQDPPTTDDSSSTALVHVPRPVPTLAERMEEHWLPDFLLRAGLLLGAFLFFLEGLGSPFSRNLFALAGFLLSSLAVLTLVFQWRVLGDWRRGDQQFLYLGLALVLTLPATAAIGPAPVIGGSMLPGAVDGPLAELLNRVKEVPGLGTAFLFMRAIVAFSFFLVTLLILMLTSAPGRRGGLLFLGILLMGICLFFHPSAETIAGFLLLGAFFHNAWETPLILPEKVRNFLRPAQLNYLMDLLGRGPLTTGETRVLLDNDPALYGELMELQLVDYDAVAREVLPGRRLLHDPASGAVATAFEYGRRMAWILVGVTYVVLPDFIPGPIDDLIVLALCTASGFSLFSLAARRRRRGMRRRY